MAINTYATLKTAMASWLDRSDLTDRIPEFITIAESTIAGDPSPTDPEALPGVRVAAQEKRVTASVSSRYTDLPSDLLELRNVQINGTTIKRLRYAPPEQIDFLFDSTETGTPDFFSIIGDQLQLAPVPNESMTAEIAYTYRWAALSADGDTNWLLTNHPEIYLYAALIAAEPFLMNDARAMTWARLYRGQVKALNSAEKKAKFSGSALVMRSDIADVRWVQ